MVVRCSPTHQRKLCHAVHCSPPAAFYRHEPSTALFASNASSEDSHSQFSCLYRPRKVLLETLVLTKHSPLFRRRHRQHQHQQQANKATVTASIAAWLSRQTSYHDCRTTDGLGRIRDSVDTFLWRYQAATPVLPSQRRRIGDTRAARPEMPQAHHRGCSQSVWQRSQYLNHASSTSAVSHASDSLLRLQSGHIDGKASPPPRSAPSPLALRNSLVL